MNDESTGTGDIVQVEETISDAYTCYVFPNEGVHESVLQFLREMDFSSPEDFIHISGTVKFYFYLGIMDKDLEDTLKSVGGEPAPKEGIANE